MGYGRKFHVYKMFYCYYDRPVFLNIFGSVTQLSFVKNFASYHNLLSLVTEEVILLL